MKLFAKINESRPEQKPASLRLAFMSAELGVPSTVWMYRQLEALLPEVQRVITWKHHSPELFPVPADKFRLVPSQFDKPLEGASRAIDSVLYPKYGGPRHGIWFDRWLRKQLKQSAVNVVLCQYGPCAMIAERACRGTGIQVFAHFHGYDITAKLSNRRYREALERHWSAFAGIIVVANYQRQWFLDHGYSADNIALIPCGAPATEIASQVATLRQTLVAPQSTRCEFLFVGRFVDKKDPLSVLKAFELCWESAPHASLRMAGYGKLEQECRDWVSTKPLELQNRIEFAGQMTPDQVIQAMARADVYVQHSRTAANGDKEGWPVTIGEAMAAGLPIVATRHAGIVDQVVEGDTGYLCEEGDWQAMGQAMTRLANQPAERLEMAKRSGQRGLTFETAIQLERLKRFVHQQTQARSLPRARRAA